MENGAWVHRETFTNYKYMKPFIIFDTQNVVDHLVMITNW